MECEQIEGGWEAEWKRKYGMRNISYPSGLQNDSKKSEEGKEWEGREREEGGCAVGEDPKEIWTKVVEVIGYGTEMIWDDE